MRLLIVSNRLPINVTEDKGNLKFTPSVGGLVSGISSYLDSLKGLSSIESEYVWVGWPGITVIDALQEEVKQKMQADFNAHPIFLSEDDMDKFYHGFCNKIIWPLFHYFPTYTMYDNAYWQQYQHVNEIFRDAVLEIIKPGDVVWVHDYHLMLLPKLLRDEIPNLSIGFFLHIPFPSFELFRNLPSQWGEEILEGLVGADLIGFHTHDYTQHFLRCVLRILGHEQNMGKILLNGRFAKAETFPMGIDFPKFNQGSGILEVENNKDKLKQQLNGFKVVLSIDRLDYTKGIIHRLRGYKTFLEENPDWQGRVVLLLIVVPSRIGVEHYQQIKRSIDELVGEINGKFGCVDWTPILYQYRFLPFNPLLAIYSISDVALITPLRDGMNLIAKEYVAARKDKTGVLILSEMAGAAQEMREAIIINPNNTEEIALALKEALEMPEKEQIRRNEMIQTRLRNYDVVRWSEDFIEQLLMFRHEQESSLSKYLVQSKIKILHDFSKAQKSLILLDYDGTLVPFEANPQSAKPDLRLLTILKNLSQDLKNDIVIISGREKQTLENWLGKANINLVGEHGALIKENGKWRLFKPLTTDWKDSIVTRLRLYASRIPGSFVEEKEFSIAWHYREVEPSLGIESARELMDDLVNFTANINVQILKGNKVIEVRQLGINKGMAALYWMNKENYDFMLAIGDDKTDEDMFHVLPANAYSVKVGEEPETRARYYLKNPRQVLELLAQMANN